MRLGSLWAPRGIHRVRAIHARAAGLESAAAQLRIDIDKHLEQFTGMGVSPQRDRVLRQAGRWENKRQRMLGRARVWKDIATVLDARIKDAE